MRILCLMIIVATVSYKWYTLVMSTQPNPSWCQFQSFKCQEDVSSNGRAIRRTYHVRKQWQCLRIIFQAYFYLLFIKKDRIVIQFNESRKRKFIFFLSAILEFGEKSKFKPEWGIQCRSKIFGYKSDFPSFCIRFSWI